jgi:chromosome segregation ATPase
MEKYAKFIIIGLAGFLLLSVILILQTFNTKLSLQKEKDRLVAENQQLAQKANEDAQRARRLDEMMKQMKESLNKLNREKEDFQNRLNLLSQEKGELLEKLQIQEQRLGVVQTQRQAPEAGVPAVEDSYWAGILKAKTDLEMQLAALRSDLKTAQLANAELQSEKNDLQLDLNTFKREKEDLQRQVEYNKKLLDSIAQEVVRERNDKLKIQESITTLKRENDVLTRQLKSISSRRYALEKKVQELQDDKAAIEHRFAQLEVKLAERVAMADDLKAGLEEIQGSSALTGASRKESVELPPIVVRPGSGPSEAKIQEGTMVAAGGKILAINKDSNFVIIDVGEEAGVKIGDTFKAYRLDKAIATLEVIQTRRNIAACDIKNEIIPLQIGDSVR